ncbi:hypothetical protein BH10BAC5_BH10BAC5_10890 [soil metagenome]
MIQKYIEAENFKPLIKFLDGYSTSHANTPKTEQKRYVVKEIKKYINGKYSGEELFHRYFDISNDLTLYKEDVSKEIGISLISNGYSFNKKKSVEILIKIADDKNWEVREYAAGAFSNIANAYPDFYKTLMKLTKHSSVNVKRAVLFAAIGLMKDDQLDKAFDLIEPLLYESSTYIKKNHGPFILGSYLGNNYPKETFAKIKEWLRIKDEHVRWNLAMAFNNSFGNKYPDEALKVLETLSKDESKVVRRAVISTLRSFHKRHPDKINNFLKNNSHINSL